MNKKYFAAYKESDSTLPDLVKSQLDSFNWLKTEGFKEIFQEFSPISDYTEKEFILEFGDFYFEEPKHDEYYARENNLTYEAPLKIKAKLTNKITGLTKEQEIFLTDFPIMTDRGTFIINGVERVIVPQLARSFGVYFTSTMFKGKEYFGSKIIPGRGSWIEIETGPDGVIYVRIDRGRKVPISSLLHIFGCKDKKEIEEIFNKLPLVKGKIDYIATTLSKDPAKNANEAYLEVYHRLRPGEPANIESAKKYIDSMFNIARYDLSEVGRYRLNHRLGKSLDNLKKESRVITLDDLISIIIEVIRLNNTPGASADDIDHLGSRRIRGVGELLAARLRVGMAQTKKNIQDRIIPSGYKKPRIIIKTITRQKNNNRPRTHKNVRRNNQRFNRENPRILQQKPRQN